MLNINWTRRALGGGVFYEATWEGLTLQAEKDKSTGYGYWQVWRGDARIAASPVSGGINKAKKAVADWVEKNSGRIRPESAHNQIMKSETAHQIVADTLPGDCVNGVQEAILIVLREQAETIKRLEARVASLEELATAR